MQLAVSWNKCLLLLSIRWPSLSKEIKSLANEVIWLVIMNVREAGFWVLAYKRKKKAHVKHLISRSLCCHITKHRSIFRLPRFLGRIKFFTNPLKLHELSDSEFAFSQIPQNLAQPSYTFTLPSVWSSSYLTDVWDQAAQWSRTG